LKIYEKILSILEEKGTLTVPLICQEVNHLLSDQEKPLLPSQVKSIVSRKKDLFRVKNGNITIHPDKNPLQLIIIVDKEDGITQKVNIDFSRKLFTYFEWRNKGDFGFNTVPARRVGDLNVLKKEVYRLHLWEWDSFYGAEEGITIGNINWTVKLTTIGKTFVSEGTDCFPENWKQLCHAIENLTGTVFLD
jgi:hypothetical protein